MNFGSCALPMCSSQAMRLSLRQGHKPFSCSMWGHLEWGWYLIILKTISTIQSCLHWLLMHLSSMSPQCGHIFINLAALLYLGFPAS